MKVLLSNKELANIIRNAVSGNIKFKFQIIIIFENLIRKESKVNGKYLEECKDFIEDKLFDEIEKFKKI